MIISRKFIDTQDKRLKDLKGDIEALEILKTFDYPYIEPYLDLEISSFWRYLVYVSFYFEFKDKELSIDKKEDFAINFIDELGGAPKAIVYGGSELPYYSIATHQPVSIANHKVSLSFKIGDEAPKAYTVKLVEKYRVDKVCEISCKK